MRHICALLIVLVIAGVGWTAPKEAKRTFRNQVVTGCLDEKPGVYVLRSDDVLKEIAQLDPIGFDKQIFARYVGHKVSITGELVSTTEPPTLRVVSPNQIKDVSQMCVPASDK